MAYINTVGMIEYNKYGITSPVDHPVDWGAMDIPYCWLQPYINKPHMIVFDDKHIDKVNDFLAMNSRDCAVSRYLIAIQGDLIAPELRPSPYRVDEEARLCLAGAKGITLDGRKAAVGGVKLTFGIVVEIPAGPRYEWAWETIRRIVCRGGQFDHE